MLARSSYPNPAPLAFVSRGQGLTIVEAQYSSSQEKSHPQRDAFFGTFAPFLRASDKPMAIACFLLFTTPPLPPFPDRKVPCFLRCIALLTVLLAARPYLAIISSSQRTSSPITIAPVNLPRDKRLSVNLATKTCTLTDEYCSTFL